VSDLRLGVVEGWVVTHDGETIKSGFRDDFEAVNWMHRRHSFSVDHAVQYEGYDIVLVRDGKVVYSYKREAQRKNVELGAARHRGSEGTAYIDLQGGRWTIRWWSQDEQRYYTLPSKPTLEEAIAYARREGFKPVVAEPHRLGVKTVKNPVPVWPEFVDAYLEAALWASATESGEPLDKNYTVRDFTQEAIDQAVKDSNDFIRANLKDLEAASSDQSQHGHDFWLTRNHHGAGFWDRGYGAFGDRLTAAAHAYGEVNAYADEDGKIRFE
jgi:hypothetical protein